MSRLRDDQYFTPPAVCAAVLPLVADLIVSSRGPIIEPAAGAMHFVEALAQSHASARNRTIAIELDPSAPTRSPFPHPYTLIGDALSFDFGPIADLVIGNPPFHLAQPFIEKALTWIRPGGAVLFVLRSSFVGGLGRHDLFATERPSLHALNPRPSFIRKRRSDGVICASDSASYSAFLFRRGYHGNTWIRWRDQKTVADLSESVGLRAPPDRTYRYTPPLYDANLRLIEPAKYGEP